MAEVTGRDKIADLTRHKEEEQIKRSMDETDMQTEAVESSLDPGAEVLTNPVAEIQSKADGNAVNCQRVDDPPKCKTTVVGYPSGSNQGYHLPEISTDSIGHQNVPCTQVDSLVFVDKSDTAYLILRLMTVPNIRCP